MIREVEEERARWESERQGWERMAEALIAQRNRTARKSGNGNNGGGGYALKDEVGHVIFDVRVSSLIRSLSTRQPFELERLYSNMEVDNRALRQKVRFLSPISSFLVSSLLCHMSFPCNNIDM